MARKQSLLPGWSSLLLDGETQLSEHPYGACLPALEVTGVKSLAPGELISCAQDLLSADNGVLPTRAHKSWWERNHAQRRTAPAPVGRTLLSRATRQRGSPDSRQP